MLKRPTGAARCKVCSVSGAGWPGLLYLWYLVFHDTKVDSQRFRHCASPFPLFVFLLQISDHEDFHHRASRITHFYKSWARRKCFKVFKRKQMAINPVQSSTFLMSGVSVLFIYQMYLVTNTINNRIITQSVATINDLKSKKKNCITMFIILFNVVRISSAFWVVLGVHSNEHWAFDRAFVILSSRVWVLLLH